MTKWVSGQESGSRNEQAQMQANALVTLLDRGDAYGAIDTIRNAGDSCAMLVGVAERWFQAKLALPATKDAPWPDDQGLSRLVFAIWPHLPIKTIAEDPSMIGPLMERILDYRVIAEKYAGQPWPVDVLEREGLA